jgi:hypothetical protein
MAINLSDFLKIFKYQLNIIFCETVYNFNLIRFFLVKYLESFLTIIFKTAFGTFLYNIKRKMLDFLLIHSQFYASSFIFY